MTPHFASESRYKNSLMYYIGVYPPMYCIYMFYVYMLVELVSIQQITVGYYNH